MVLKTFKRGGVHPPENKFSEGISIQKFPIPKTVYIPVGQVLGAPSVPLVAKGEKVKAGQLIAKGEAFISANVHSSVSGSVIKVDEIVETSGYRKLSIIVETNGDDWVEGIDTSETVVRDFSYTSDEIIQIIKNSGIVGLGGATFPSHVKLMIPKDKQADVLIINGVECEPYLTSDHRLMLEKGEQLLIGVSILMKGLKVDKAIIGIENNKSDAIQHLSNLSKSFEGISVQGLKVKYPQGGEKQLIKALIGREVPSGKLPIEVGCVVNNVGTAFAVYEAVQKKKPLVERVVTVTGKSLANTANYLVRIGTPVSELIAYAGGLPTDTGKVVNGGPMMGKSLNSLESPVTKGTSGIVLFKTEDSKRGKTVSCIRCGKCVSVCPMGLEPYILAQFGELQRYEDAEINKVMDCMECGSCVYTCPSFRPLLDYIRMNKTQVGKLIRSRANK